MEPVLIILIVVAAGVVAALVAALLLQGRQRPVSTDRPPDTALLPNPPGELQPFIALDVDSIFDLYEQTPDAIVVRSTTNTRSSGIKIDADGGPLAVGGEHTVSSAVQNDFQPVQNATRAVSIVERYLQSTNRITSFDLTTPTDEGPLTDLLKTLRAEAARIGLTVPELVEKELRRAWTQQNQPVTGTRPESLRQFVRVRAEFTISPGPVHGAWLLESVPREDRLDAVRITIVCRRSHLRSSFPEDGSTVTATCLGVPTPDGENHLKLQPCYSVYLS